MDLIVDEEYEYTPEGLRRTVYNHKTKIKTVHIISKEDLDEVGMGWLLERRETDVREERT